MNILCKNKKDYVDLQYALFENGYWWSYGNQKIYMPHYHIDWDLHKCVIIADEYEKKLVFDSNSNKKADMTSGEWIKNNSKIKKFVDNIFEGI